MLDTRHYIMNDEAGSGEEERSERALIYRTLGEYVSVETLLSPLFRYMQWYASRTPDEVYMLTVDRDCSSRTQ
jgi:hypothetical protein